MPLSMPQVGFLKAWPQASFWLSEVPAVSSSGLTKLPTAAGV